MSRSFTIPYDLSRYIATVKVSSSLMATADDGVGNINVSTVQVEGQTFLAVIPTDETTVTLHYPVIEQQTCGPTVKNTRLPYSLTVGRKIE